jgi:acetyl esterase
MTRIELDPQLEAFLPLLPEEDLSDPVADRKDSIERAAARPPLDTGDMEIEDRTVPADPDVAVRVYRPREAQGAVLWLHGGGYVVGNLDTEHPWCARIAEGAGAVVVSVNYRLSPEHRFPAAMDDAYAVLNWTVEHAAELGVDPERIAVGGHSAGAGLAAALALRARDQEGPRICFQLLNDKVAAAWRHFLGDTGASQYAAPARATDLSGLPPAYIATAEFDPVRDEGIDYAQRLLQAGVQVELHQFSGTFHGSQVISSAEVSQRQLAALTAALRRGVGARSHHSIRSVDRQSVAH